MSANKLFKNLGFVLIRSDDDYIIFEKELEQGIKKVVSFCEQLQDVNISYENMMGRQYPSIDMELFEAIQLKLLELGWISK